MKNVVPYANCTGQVVLDAGHGGTDSGAVNNKYSLTEKEQTLKVANRTKALLEADGYSVCMRRTLHSEALSNNDRYTYANTTGARIFVSIHMIGASSPATDYTTTLFGNGARIKNSQTPSLALSRPCPRQTARERWS